MNAGIVLTGHSIPHFVNLRASCTTKKVLTEEDFTQQFCALNLSKGKAK